MLVDKPLLGEDTYLDPAFADGLIGCWLMNEGEGNTIADLSGNNNEGTITNAVWQPEKFGYGLYFDGADDYVDCGNPSTLQLQAMSIVVWAKPEANSRGIITKGISRGIVTERDWDIFGDGTDLRFIVSNGAANIVNIDGGGFPTLNVWHQFVATWDGTTSADGAKIYVDGVLWDTATASATNIQNTHNVHIGGRWTFNDDYDFLGNIDHCLIYNRASTTSEVEQLYREPFWGFKKNDAGIYHL